MSQERQNQRASNILFLIRSLGGGGAERQLTLLANELAARGHSVSIAVFYSGGVFEAAVDDSRVRVVDLQKRGRWDVWAFGWRLTKLLRSERPAVVHSYATAANLWAAATVWVAPRSTLIWGVRDSRCPVDSRDWSLRCLRWLAARLSRRAQTIIINSKSGLDDLKVAGFHRTNLVHIPNGIDTRSFYVDRAAGRRQRREWGISDSEQLVGMVGRFHPEKDPVNFLKASQIVASQLSNVRFVGIGLRSLQQRQELEAVTRDLGLADRVLWVSARSNLREVYNALDVICSPSQCGEGFPNVVGEAMACGVPAVVTDVGDSARVVADTGFLVPPSDSPALAAALLRCLGERNELGERASRRIVAEFSVARLVERTEAALRLQPAALGSRTESRAEADRLSDPVTTLHHRDPAALSQTRQ